MINYQFFPRSHGITKEMQVIIDCFKKIETTLDDGKHRVSNDVLALLRPLLEDCGYDVERGKGRDEKIDVPVLFGENNVIDKSFYADAINKERNIVIEIEAGRAVRNNQFLKDIFQACMMFEVEYLVIAVLNEYHINTGGGIISHDYQEVKTFLETLYISNRLKLPLKGILLIGYWAHTYHSLHKHYKNPSLWDNILQFRPSGIRVKPGTYFPALVAITQTSIVGSRKRFLTLRECARLQSFPDTFQPDVIEAQAYKQFGNSVNVETVKIFAKYMFGDKNILKKYSVQSSIIPVNFLEIVKEFPEEIIENKDVVNANDLDPKKNLLVSLVKNDTIKMLLDGSINIYYTGKKFPSTVALNHLYYFMPYRKGKGIRDLYYIKVARIGSKHEVHPESDPNDLRLVFEIEFVNQLFSDYKPIRLAIWETFTDTTLEKILQIS